jgi:predicted nucleotidyltransferase
MHKVIFLVVKINAMLTEQVIFEKLRAIKPLLAEKFRVSSIGFFGSYANGKK